jgi:hypothetical protein
MAKKLYEARMMRTRKEVDTFEEARVALYETGDPAVLDDLFAAFDDATEQNEVMWGLIHDIEGFGLDVYLAELAKAVPRMLPQAKEWAMIFHERILNSKEVSQLYREILQNLPEETRAPVALLLEEIAQSKPKLKKRAQGLVKAKKTRKEK